MSAPDVGGLRIAMDDAFLGPRRARRRADGDVERRGAQRLTRNPVGQRRPSTPIAIAMALLSATPKTVAMCGLMQGGGPRLAVEPRATISILREGRGQHQGDQPSRYRVERRHRTASSGASIG
jgi:hypothetical protein